MGKVLEAELIIKGSDKTGAAFAGVIKHAEQLKRALGGMAAMPLNDEKLRIATAELRRQTGAVNAQNAAWRAINSTIALGNRELQNRATLITRLAGRFRGAMQNMGFYLAGPAVLAGTKRAISSGAQIQNEMIKSRMAGVPESEMSAARARADDLHTQYPNVGIAEQIERYRELRSVLAHKEETPQLIGAAIQAASALKALGLSTESLPFAYKTAEVEGLAQDPKRFREFLDSYVKAVQVMGKTITPEAMLRGAQQLKASAALLSDRFKNTTYLSMLQDMGTRAGAGVNAAVAEVLGNFQGQHSAAKQFVALGLAREEDFEKTKTGEIMGLKTGRHIKDWELASRDLDLYVWQKLIPALTAHGYTTQEQQIAEVMRLFPYKRASDVIAKLIQQQPSFEQHAKLYEAAQGLNATDTAAQSATVALGSLTEALRNFSGVLTSPMMKNAAELMNAAAHRIAKASGWYDHWQKEHPHSAEAIGTGAIGLGAYFGTKWTYGLARRIFGGPAQKAATGALTRGAPIAMLKKGVVPGAAIAALAAVKADSRSGNTMRSSLRELLGIDDPHEPAPWMPGGAWNRAQEMPAGGFRHLNVDDIHRTLYGEAPAAKIEGSADIRVKVEAGDGLVAKIEEIVNRGLQYLFINGHPPTGTTGSTGVAMPEATPGAAANL